MGEPGAAAKQIGMSDNLIVHQDGSHSQSGCPVSSSEVTLPEMNDLKKNPYYHAVKIFEFKLTNPASGEGVRGMMCNLIGSTA